MSDTPTIVVDTNVLVNLAMPVVDGRDHAPCGEDPLIAALSTYDVHVPASVIGGVTTTANGDDLLAAAATTVLRATHHLSSHEIHDTIDEPLEYGLDTGETHAIWLANNLSAAMFVTDEFNTTNYLLVSLALDDRSTLYTTPHLLCVLVDHHVLSQQYVDHALSYYTRAKDWDQAYIEQLRAQYLTTDKS